MGDHEIVTDIETCDMMVSNLYTRYKHRCEGRSSHFYLFGSSDISGRCDNHYLLSLASYASNIREITREEAVVMLVMEE